MLNAVLNGETQGILRQDYTGEFTGYEDSLTATVFERLFYLSQPRREAILDVLLQDSELIVRAADLGILQSYEFWPRWHALEGRITVPDVHVTFERADLIVEAKQWDLPQHYFDQWAREIRAMPPGRSGRQLLLLMIGGLSEYNVRHVLALADHLYTNGPFERTSQDSTGITAVSERNGPWIVKMLGVEMDFDRAGIPTLIRNCYRTGLYSSADAIAGVPGPHATQAALSPYSTRLHARGGGRWDSHPTNSQLTVIS